MKMKKKKTLPVFIKKRNTKKHFAGGGLTTPSPCNYRLLLSQELFFTTSKRFAGTCERLEVKESIMVDFLTVVSTENIYLHWPWWAADVEAQQITVIAVVDNNGMRSFFFRACVFKYYFVNSFACLCWLAVGHLWLQFSGFPLVVMCLHSGLSRVSVLAFLSLMEHGFCFITLYSWEVTGQCLSVVVRTTSHTDRK